MIFFISVLTVNQRRAQVNLMTSQLFQFIVFVIKTFIFSQHLHVNSIRKKITSTGMQNSTILFFIAQRYASTLYVMAVAEKWRFLFLILNVGHQPS